MNELVTLDPEEIPEPLPENTEALACLEQSRRCPRLKRALRRVAGGQSVRLAAEAEGYEGTSSVYREAKRFGLVNPTLAEIAAGHRRVAHLSNELVEERLANDPDSISTKDAAVVAGISMDKALLYEKQAGGGGKDYVGALEQLVARLAEEGHEISAEVTLRPAAPREAEVSGIAEPVELIRLRSPE